MDRFRIVAKVLAAIGLLAVVFLSGDGHYSWWSYALGPVFLVLFVVGWVHGGFVLAELQDTLRKLACKRGHPGPFLPTATGVTLFVGWVACVAIWDRFDVTDGVTAWLAFAPLVAAWALLCCGLAAVLATVLVLLVPARRARSAGPRRARFPWRALAISVFVGGIAGCVVWWSRGNSVIDALGLIILGWAAAAMAWAYGERVRAPTYERAHAEDPRPPVLYLRSFARESEAFAHIPARGILSGEAPSFLPDEEHRPTFEQFFRPALEAELGPFVALGNPEEYLPPLGAAREYVPDERWRDELERIAESSVCVLAFADHTPSLQWEFTHLRQLGLHRKLFIVTPPSGAEDWVNVVHMLTAAGYAADEEGPGMGAVIAFDEDGTATIIARGARSPEDYVRAIVARLAADPVTVVSH